MMSQDAIGATQHSLEWFRARLGRITGSKAGVLMKKGRSKTEEFSDTAKGYLYEVAGERLLNPDIVNDDGMFDFYLEQTSVNSKAMRFGNEQEASAREAYMALGTEVTETGIWPHPTLECFASSPDGIIGNGEGCLEIKCPTLGTFAKYASQIRDAETLLAVNPDYYWQCMSHMACTGAQFCDFVVFSPFTTPPMRITRIPRDNAAIEQLEQRIRLVDDKINEYVKLIRND